MSTYFLISYGLALYVIFGVVAGVYWLFLGPNWVTILWLRPRRCRKCGK